MTLMQIFIPLPFYCSVNIKNAITAITTAFQNYVVQHFHNMYFLYISVITIYYNTFDDAVLSSYHCHSNDDQNYLLL